MRTANRVAFNAKLFENDKPNMELKKIANTCTKLKDYHGYSSFMINPTCLLHDSNGFHYDSEDYTGDHYYKMGLDNNGDIPNLEKYEISRQVPRIYVSGKYRAFMQLLLQAKYAYPDRIMMIKHIYPECILFYNSIDENFIIFENNIDKIVAIIEGGLVDNEDHNQ